MHRILHRARDPRIPKAPRLFQAHRHPQAGLISRGHSPSRAFFPSPAPIWGPRPADATPSINPPVCAPALPLALALGQLG
ncbi:hypothetical protein M440DRAFT_325657 [Trichoderma longibrachiatum ATCC 18648]|uniref:Uncharacterized protein n=1 Tax=Trichoderma longibrachiatum ATCC 18648 TaxID=983965 RepID=A0A2T4C242_TRILO|nr:hypothetical protein M440DRAFT_325657 [Trichoderma longibrachiatum ATCC 18648]